MEIPNEFIDELVSRCDIVETVESYVQLTKRSGSNRFGLCPFHSEKTPSFSVSSDKQIYHCFGCGKGGGVINFIMEIENVSFKDAVHILADRVGMKVPDDNVSDTQQSRRARLLEINKEAARWFYEMLSKPEGKTAVDYINQRGLSLAMVRKFGLGAAPDSWDALTSFLLKKGYTREELLAAGVAKSRRDGKGIYDAFRNRLIFPIIDVRGSVLGFSGRILGDGEPKYYNSPDTEIYNKRNNLFGLNIAKKTKSGRLILVEGNIDVVMLHQQGFDSAVASLGTALTAEQVRLMSRYTDNVVICYDADNAGQLAAQRAITLFENTGIHIKILRMNGAKDPDEFINANGRDAFSLLLEQSENRTEYRLLAIKNKYDLTSDDGKLRFLNEAADMLGSISNRVEREVYSARAAEYIGVSSESVLAEANKANKKRAAAMKKKQERDITRPVQAAQPSDRKIRYENIRSATAEEGVIRLLIKDPELITAISDLTADDFTSPFLSKVFRDITERFSSCRPISEALISSSLEPAESDRLSAIMQKPETAAEGSRALKDYINIIHSEKIKKASDKDILAYRDKLFESKKYGGKNG